MSTSEPEHIDDMESRIVNEPLMTKFQFYGFFKNLKFFEPYLLVILLSWGLNLFQIGMLVLVRESVMFLFEVPSGILADKFGKKNELMTCFVFYIIAFVLFFLGPGWIILVAASAFFGLGEAFRSGTHKAMLLLWMERKGYLEYKSYVYGRTRSWSLLGSALSGVLSIFMVLTVSADRWTFLLIIIPYAMDLLLIASYPSYMNERAAEPSSLLREMGQGVKDIGRGLKEPELRRGILTVSSYNALFSTLKDYIQPIVVLSIALIIVNVGVGTGGMASDDLIKVMLGLLYAAFYLISSFSSRNAYRVKQLGLSPKRAMDWLYHAFAFTLILNAVLLWLDLPAVAVGLYLFIYILYNIRRPLGVGYIGGLIDKDQRATMLSVESQCKALLTLALAPLLGYIADSLSIAAMFVAVAVMMVLANSLYLRGEGGSGENDTA